MTQACLARHQARLAWLCSALCLIAILLVALPGPLSATQTSTTPQAGNLHITHAQTWEEPSTGFTPASYTLDAGSMAGPWTDVSLPHAVPLRRLLRAAQLPRDSASTNITWYRLQTDELANFSSPHYLYVPRWKAAGRIAIYGDAQLLYQSHSDLLTTPSNLPLWIPLDNDGTTAPPRVITVRIQHLDGLDSALSSVRIGTSTTMRWRYQSRIWLQSQLPLMSSAAFLAIGVFTFFVWYRQRRDRLYLLYALTSLAVFVRTLRYYIGADWIPLSDDWFNWLDLNARFWIVLLIHLILVNLTARPRPWLTRAMIITTVSSTLLTLPLLPGLPQPGIIAPLMFVPLIILSSLVFTTGIRDAWRVRSRQGLLLAGWGLLAVGFGLHDWLLQNNLVNIEHLFLGAFVNLGACIVLMYAIFQHYMSALDEVEHVNAGLESRLRSRAAELAASYQRLREAEQQRILLEERRRMTQDMHDGLGASLISALEAVERGRLDHTGMADILRDCIEDLKLSIDSLEPVEADLLLLLGTLRFRLGPRLQAMGIDLFWDIQDIPPLDWLEPKQSLHILRILQEAFTNIIKHASATEIRVSTTLEADGVVVSISDDGPGFELEQALQQGGKGLQNQLRRAQAVGGRVHWNSTAGGTQFQLWLPVAPAAQG